MKVMPLSPPTPYAGQRSAPPPKVVVSDTALVVAAQSDPRKFEPLYSKYYEPILRFVYKRLDSKEEAYDVASQVFLNALQNLSKYEDRGFPFSSWLYRIAVNELNQFYRRTNRYRSIDVQSGELSHLLVQTQVSERNTDHSLLLECMTRLSSSDYLMLEMRYFEDRPFKEIAQVLEITENNAKVRTYRALDRLKKLLS